MRLRTLTEKSAPCFVLFLLVMSFVVAGFSFLSSSNAQVLQTELSYDTGVSIGAGSIGFYGVNFSLPTGISSAKLVAVRYAWYAANDSLTIHITGANFSRDIVPPMSTNSTVGIGGWNTLDISSLNVVLSGNFFIVIETTGVPRNTLLFDNSTNTNRSFWGTSSNSLTNPNTFGAFMVRVVIEPFALAPTPTATPTPAPTATPTAPASPVTTPIPAATSTPAPTMNLTPTPAPSPSITSTPTEAATQTPTPTQTFSPAFTETPAPSITPTNATSTGSVSVELQVALIVIVVVVVIVVGNRKVKNKT